MSSPTNPQLKSNLSFHVRLEAVEDRKAVENLTQEVFGSEMFKRAAYALRKGLNHEVDLSFVAEIDGTIVGSVRQTTILWGGKKVLMLGPLCVLRKHKNFGIGSALMRRSVEAARSKTDSGGQDAIVLVGDYEYYAPFGFKRISPSKISMPRSTDPNRVLVCELAEDVAQTYSGAATRCEEV